jgi:hypothetical protein
VISVDVLRIVAQDEDIDTDTEGVPPEESLDDEEDEEEDYDEEDLDESM